LREIKELQERGKTLVEIARLLGGGEGKVPEATPWWGYQAHSDVLVYVRADLPPWRMKRIQRALGELAGALADESAD
jgi:hypothetical protein